MKGLFITMMFRNILGVTAVGVAVVALGLGVNGGHDRESTVAEAPSPASDTVIFGTNDFYQGGSIKP